MVLNVHQAQATQIQITSQPLMGSLGASGPLECSLCVFTPTLPCPQRICHRIKTNASTTYSIKCVGSWHVELKNTSHYKQTLEVVRASHTDGGIAQLWHDSYDILASVLGSCIYTARFSCCGSSHWVHWSMCVPCWVGARVSCPDSIMLTTSRPSSRFH